MSSKWFTKMFNLTGWQVVGVIFLAGLIVGATIGGCTSYKVGYSSGYRRCERDNDLNNGWFQKAPVKQKVTE